MMLQGLPGKRMIFFNERTITAALSKELNNDSSIEPMEQRPLPQTAEKRWPFIEA